MLCDASQVPVAQSLSSACDSCWATSFCWSTNAFRIDSRPSLRRARSITSLMLMVDRPACLIDNKVVSHVRPIYWDSTSDLEAGRYTWQTLLSLDWLILYPAKELSAAGLVINHTSGWKTNQSVPIPSPSRLRWTGEWHWRLIASFLHPQFYQ